MMLFTDQKQQNIEECMKEYWFSLTVSRAKVLKKRLTLYLLVSPA